MKIRLDMIDEYESYKKNNTDEYGKAIVDYTERWAELMEVEMLEGKNFENMAKTTSCIADTEGITGFMYGCSVSAISSFWVHGEELRKWHNLDTQIRNEGEKANESGKVLNPALLVIGEYRT